MNFKSSVQLTQKKSKLFFHKCHVKTIGLVHDIPVAFHLLVSPERKEKDCGQIGKKILQKDGTLIDLNRYFL